LVERSLRERMIEGSTAAYKDRSGVSLLSNLIQKGDSFRNER